MHELWGAWSLRGATCVRVAIAQATEAEVAEHEAATEQREAAPSAAARAQAEAVRASTALQPHCSSAEQLALEVAQCCLSRVCVPCDG